MEGLIAKLLLMLLMLLLLLVVSAQRVEEGETSVKERFLLQKAHEVIKTEAGELRVVRGYSFKDVESPMHIGFINMEPSSLFLPQYMDSTLTIFVRRGEAKIGWIHRSKLEEKELSTGDLYVIPAGSTFYIANTGEGQRLRLVCSIDTKESLRTGFFQSFFIGGGLNPRSVLTGFGPKTLATALNVSISELDEFLGRQVQGPIVYANVTHKHSLTQIHQQKAEEAINEEEETTWTWPWRKLLNSVLLGNNKAGKKTVDFPDVYSLYKRKPDFKNKYGSTMSLYDHDYAPLKIPNISVYLVNLTAGSMLGPHLNPMATEIGIVLQGSGSIQMVYPNGSTAMSAEVGEEDVFWVPRYFPFCQIASKNGPFVFFGFTTASRDNRPQILVGASSVLRTMDTAELATAFGLSRDAFDRLVKSQNESMIFGSPFAAPPLMDADGGIRSVGSDEVFV